MVYKSSPTQRAPSEPPEAGPSLSGRQVSADEDTLRQRLISAVQRPSGSDSGQLAETLSLRWVLQHGLLPTAHAGFLNRPQLT